MHKYGTLAGAGALAVLLAIALRTGAGKGVIEGQDALLSMIALPGGTWVAGTGRNYPYVNEPDGVARVGGVYLSTDSGVTWSRTLTCTSEAGVRRILRLTDGTLLAATYIDGSVYRSTDSGANWTRTLTVAGKVASGLCQTATGRVLVATSYLNPTTKLREDVLRKSTDGGATWTTIATPPGHINDMVAVASTLYLASQRRYDAYTSPYWFGAQLYTSTDDGDTWSVHRAINERQQVRWFWRASNSTLFAALNGPGRYLRSADSGATWTNCYLGGTAPQTILRQAGFAAWQTPTWHTPSGPHEVGRIGTFAEGANGRLYALTNNCVAAYTSADSGLTWSYLRTWNMMEVGGADSAIGAIVGAGHYALALHPDFGNPAERAYLIDLEP
jgi:photosystem II stability/assembly factor-like uncharacterized protein